MSQLVSTEITIAPEYFPALVAFVRLVVGMSQEMSLEVGSLVETSPTNWTLVRRFFHMEDFVNSKCARLAKAFATLQTLKWLLF